MWFCTFLAFSPFSLRFLWELFLVFANCGIRFVKIQQLWEPVERLLQKRFTLSEYLTYQQLHNIVERVIWVRSAELAKSAISWEYVNSKKTKSIWKNVRILNIAKLASAEFQVTKAFANLLELNVCESKFNDSRYLVEVSKMCNRLRILNVSGCDITDKPKSGSWHWWWSQELLLVC